MTRYSEIYNYQGKAFRYDYENSLLQYVYIVEEDDELLGKKGDIVEIDAVGLNKEHWENKPQRDEYLFEYVADLEAEAEFYAEC